MSETSANLNSNDLNSDQQNALVGQNSNDCSTEDDNVTIENRVSYIKRLFSLKAVCSDGNYKYVFSAGNIDAGIFICNICKWTVRIEDFFSHLISVYHRKSLAYYKALNFKCGRAAFMRRVNGTFLKQSEKEYYCRMKTVCDLNLGRLVYGLSLHKEKWSLYGLYNLLYNEYMKRTTHGQTKTCNKPEIRKAWAIEWSQVLKTSLEEKIYKEENYVLEKLRSEKLEHERAFRTEDNIIRLVQQYNKIAAKIVEKYTTIKEQYDLSHYNVVTGGEFNFSFDSLIELILLQNQTNPRNVQKITEDNNKREEKTGTESSDMCFHVIKSLQSIPPVTPNGGQQQDTNNTEKVKSSISETTTLNNSREGDNLLKSSEAEVQNKTDSKNAEDISTLPNENKPKVILETEVYDNIKPISTSCESSQEDKLLKKLPSQNFIPLQVVKLPQHVPAIQPVPSSNAENISCLSNENKPKVILKTEVCDNIKPISTSCDSSQENKLLKKLPSQNFIPLQIVKPPQHLPGIQPMPSSNAEDASNLPKENKPKVISKTEVCDNIKPISTSCDSSQENILPKRLPSQNFIPLQVVKPLQHVPAIQPVCSSNSNIQVQIEKKGKNIKVINSLPNTKSRIPKKNINDKLTTLIQVACAQTCSIKSKQNSEIKKATDTSTTTYQPSKSRMRSQDFFEHDVNNELSISRNRSQEFIEHDTFKTKPSRSREFIIVKTKPSISSPEKLRCSDTSAISNECGKNGMKSTKTKKSRSRKRSRKFTKHDTVKPELSISLPKKSRWSDTSVISHDCSKNSIESVKIENCLWFIEDEADNIDCGSNEPSSISKLKNVNLVTQTQNESLSFLEDDFYYNEGEKAIEDAKKYKNSVGIQNEILSYREERLSDGKNKRTQQDIVKNIKNKRTYDKNLHDIGTERKKLKIEYVPNKKKHSQNIEHLKINEEINYGKMCNFNTLPKTNIQNSSLLESDKSSIINRYYVGEALFQREEADRVKSSRNSADFSNKKEINSSSIFSRNSSKHQLNLINISTVNNHGLMNKTPVADLSQTIIFADDDDFYM